MNYKILEMLYNIPELQTLSYQIYQKMPERISREAHLAQVRQECELFSDPELQEQASFFTGVYLGWRLSRALGA